MSDENIKKYALAYAEALPPELAELAPVVQAAFIQGAKIGEFYEKERWVNSLALIQAGKNPIVDRNGPTSSRH